MKKRVMKNWVTPCELMRYARRRWRSYVYSPLDKVPAKVYRYVTEQSQFSSTYMLKQHARADWTGVDPEIHEFYGKLYKELKRRGLPVYAHTVYRSPALQAMLHAEGKSQVADGPHQRGAAVDVVDAFYHWDARREYWDFVGAVGKDIIKKNRYSIEWGGDWSFYDPAHWQLRNWRNSPVVESHADPTPAMPGKWPEYVGMFIENDEGVLRYV